MFFISFFILSNQFYFYIFFLFEYIYINIMCVFCVFEHEHIPHTPQVLHFSISFEKCKFFQFRMCFGDVIMITCAIICCPCALIGILWISISIWEIFPSLCILNIVFFLFQSLFSLLLPLSAYFIFPPSPSEKMFFLSVLSTITFCQFVLFEIAFNAYTYSKTIYLI